MDYRLTEDWQDGYEKGYDDGYSNGFADAQDEYDRSIAEIVAQYEALLREAEREGGLV